MSSEIEANSPFIGEKVKLRAVEMDDLDDIMQHWNTYEMRISLGRYIPESRQQREEWIKKVTKEMQKGEAYNFAVIEKETEKFLGVAALKRVNNISRTAFMSVAIYNPKDQGRGFGADSVKCILKIGFDVLNLHRIELHVYDFLESGKHIYKKLGFKETGVRRKASFVAGRYVDDLVMDILVDEYRKLNPI
ncbi:MAG: GNAT family N-acetyltransferase [Candidatus Heimdallarchaeota archaeon]|nr:GNAT family N-acetyltransferase [Candidatus Heimdallarchaeota archaeon]MCG3256802.1 GNAT family N-acetyltransferase [Candidatus Heimdallarchaeota archaeon]MCK4611865.1 GNAT family N-acetyltransferase [Candidatus Heimdallarchaeota archaeon]